MAKGLSLNQLQNELSPAWLTNLSTDGRREGEDTDVGLTQATVYKPRPPVDWSGTLVLLQPPDVTLVPPDDWGGSPKFRDKCPDECPQSRPPECQPELGQLTDTLREERDRVQTLCNTPVAARNYDDGNTLHVSDYLKTQDQLCILDKVKTTHQCTLDILIIAASHDTQHNLL